jgi:hypothetical protein
LLHVALDQVGDEGGGLDEVVDIATFGGHELHLLPRKLAHGCERRLTGVLELL